MAENHEHTRFASDPLQMPKLRAPTSKTPRYVSAQSHPSVNSEVILLAEMQIWKNPVGRIQNFLNSFKLIG
jgi:hypothetical protein